MAIPIRKLFLLLLFFVLILLAMHFFSKSLSSTIHNRFNLDSEANIPTWFSTLLLFCVSLTSLVIYILNRSIASKVSWNSFWIGFGAIYLFLSLDEAARIHEIIDSDEFETYVHKIFDITWHLKWIYVYAPFSAIFFMVCTYFLIVINKNNDLRNWILGGLIVYALGGLIGESIDYFFYSSQVEVVFEEGFELLGTIMVFRGCLQELNRRYGVVYNHSVNT
jgi:hypothetical protein